MGTSFLVQVVTYLFLFLNLFVGANFFQISLVGLTILSCVAFLEGGDLIKIGGILALHDDGTDK